MVCWVYSLELPEAILMSTHNIQFHDTMRKFHKKIPRYLFSWAIGRIQLGLKNEFESAMVNKPIGVRAIEVQPYIFNISTTATFLQQPILCLFAAVVPYAGICHVHMCKLLASVAQSDACPTGDQEVTGSIPAGSANILSWRLIMKYFLLWFSPFCWFKKGSCQSLAKECAQVLVNPLKD